MFPCPKCGNTASVSKRKWISYLKAYKRVYACSACNEVFLTDEKVTEARKIGRPKKDRPLVPVEG
jgi:transcriptional regulator NrdR family protein